MKKALLLLFLLQYGIFSEITVGSKKFTESVILGEIATLIAGKHSDDVNHLRELGGTRVLWNGLNQGEVDIYPEYTGTIAQEILGGYSSQWEMLRDTLSQIGIGMTKPLGFNNTYILGMKRQQAEELGIETISDLRNHPGLSLGFSNEFMNRNDGWPGLKSRYNLPQPATGLDHDLAYRGLENGAIDVIDLYATDAEIEYYNLKTLKDDQNFFPEYNAVYLYRIDFNNSHPQIVTDLKKLEGQIPQSKMVSMNAKAKLEGVPAGSVAAEFLQKETGKEVEFKVAGFWERFAKNTREHFFLVGISLLAAIAVAVPLGIAAAKFHWLGQPILAITGIVQTIPALAMLVFMIPLLGIGAAPAIAALFLFSLLPIVRNTHAGLQEIPPAIRDSAEALGLSSMDKLLRIELPLASRSILAGVKTAAVINIGTTTLGALIGAGGYGQPILTGIRLDDLGLILEGAVPAAGLAIFAQLFFEAVGLIFVPRGLRKAN